MQPGILPGNIQGSLADVVPQAFEVRPAQEDRDDHRPRACAHLEDGASLRRQLGGLFHQDLGLAAGNEHVAVHEKGMGKELLASENIRDRLSV